MELHFDTEDQVLFDYISIIVIGFILTILKSLSKNRTTQKPANAIGPISRLDTPAKVVINIKFRKEKHYSEFLNPKDFAHGAFGFLPLQASTRFLASFFSTKKEKSIKIMESILLISRLSQKKITTCDVSFSVWGVQYSVSANKNLFA